MRVEGIMGTSAGALTGSLYAAGYSPKQVSSGGKPTTYSQDGAAAVTPQGIYEWGCDPKVV